MQEEIEITIRQAIPDDALEILRIGQILAKETDFFIMDEVGLNLTVSELAEQLAILYESCNNILLVALANDKIIGLASVATGNDLALEQIGEVGISILQEYWGLGLGSLMIEEIIYWAQESGLSRLELKVQKRNQRAIHLYEKFGFQKQAIINRGAKSKEGNFLEVLCMSHKLE